MTQEYVPYSSDPEQAGQGCFVMPDLGQNCLQRSPSREAS